MQLIQFTPPLLSSEVRRARHKVPLLKSWGWISWKSAPLLKNDFQTSPHWYKSNVWWKGANFFINKTPISPFWHWSNFRSIQQETEFYYKRCSCCSYCSGNSKVLEAINHEPWAKSTYIFLTINYDISQSI